MMESKHFVHGIEWIVEKIGIWREDLLRLLQNYMATEVMPHTWYWCWC